jgi:hypothetical protein
MPGLQHEQLEAYLTQVIEAVEQRDKTTLRQCGQRDGFVNNRIRRLVWYSLVLFSSETYVRPCLLDCVDCWYCLYGDEVGFPDLDERDKVTIQQDVRRSFTRVPGIHIAIVPSC